MSGPDTAPNIATVYEKEALEKLRASPAPQYNLTPDGLEGAQIDYELDRWRERRIHYLDRRLTVAGRVFRSNVANSFGQEM